MMRMGNQTHGAATMRLEEPYADRPKCYLCGSKAIAMWQADQALNVCRDCAVNKLIPLVADAIYHPIHAHVMSATKEIERVMWKALYVAASHDCARSIVARRTTPGV